MQAVPAHAHCEICSTVVKVGERFCSKQCVDKNDELVAQKKKAMWKFVAVIVGIMLVFTALRMGWI
jgi:predicted nucleic acid-binding Zn ribbon protein